MFKFTEGNLKSNNPLTGKVSGNGSPISVKKLATKKSKGGITPWKGFKDPFKKR